MLCMEIRYLGGTIGFNCWRNGVYIGYTLLLEAGQTIMKGNMLQTPTSFKVQLQGFQNRNRVCDTMFTWIRQPHVMTIQIRDQRRFDVSIGFPTSLIPPKKALADFLSFLLTSGPLTCLFRSTAVHLQYTAKSLKSRSHSRCYSEPDSLQLALYQSGNTTEAATSRRKHNTNTTKHHTDNPANNPSACLTLHERKEPNRSHKRNHDTQRHLAPM